MIALKLNFRLFCLLCSLLVIGLFCLLPFAAAQNVSNEVSVDSSLLIQGRVARVNVEKEVMAVKPSKGQRVYINVNWKTAFVGVSSLQELKKESRVKVWYTVSGEEKRAVKIEKLPDLGC